LEGEPCAYSLKGSTRPPSAWPTGAGALIIISARADLALEGKPGSPEFIASYNAAAERKVAVRSDVLQSILRDFQVSDEFTSKAPRTRKDYAGIIAKIEKKFGDFPLAGINKEPDQARGAFLEWRDKLAS